jgi:hypothetical protein
MIQGPIIDVLVDALPDWLPATFRPVVYVRSIKTVSVTVAFYIWLVELAQPAQNPKTFWKPYV